MASVRATIYLRTMALSTRTSTILGSLVLGAAFIGGAFLLSSPNFGIGSAGAQSAEELLQAYASADTDGDGLPDWQEVIYGTDPENPSSVQADLTDLEALEEGLIEPKFRSSKPAPPEGFSTVSEIEAGPDTLTDQFSRTFLEKYLLTRGESAPSSAELQSFVSDAAADLSRQAEEAPAYRIANLSTRGSSAEDIAQYIQDLDRAVSSNSPSFNERDAFEHFADYILNGNEESLTRVAEVGKNYTDTAQAIVAVRVPPQFSSAHLALANKYATFGSILADMASMDTDPLLGLVGATRYIDAWQATMESIFALAQTVQQTMRPN